MGPLPEATVSGSVAHLEDGADEVPIKSWLVTLPASLDGFSEVDVKHTKKNLLLPQNADSSSVTVNGITRSYLLSSQTFNMIGTNTKTDSAWLIFNGSDWIIDGLKKGETYTFYHNLGASMYSQITYYDTNGALKALVNLAGSAGKNNTRTFTIPSDFDRVRSFQIGVYASATDINEDAVFMLFAGSSATTYEPYTAPTVSTVNLGRTIYGGTANVVNGEGESTHAKYVVTGQETGYFLAGTNNNGNRIDFSMTQAQTPLYSGGLSNIGENKACLNSGTWTIGAWCIYSSRMYIVVPNEYTTYETALQYLLDNNATFTFPLATPETFTFTPITPTPETALGVNNFWADSGDTEVTYRADINLALGGQ
jgi:hypothetical protein